MQIIKNICSLIFCLFVLTLSSCVKIELLSDPCPSKLPSPIFTINNTGTIYSSDTLKYTALSDSALRIQILTPDGKTIENGEPVIAYGTGNLTYKAFAGDGLCKSDFTSLSVAVQLPQPPCSPNLGRFALGTSFVPNVFNNAGYIISLSDEYYQVTFNNALTLKIKERLDSLTIYNITENSYLLKGQINATFNVGSTNYVGKSGKMYVSSGANGDYVLTFCNMSFQNQNSGALTSGGTGKSTCYYD